MNANNHIKKPFAQLNKAYNNSFKKTRCVDFYEEINKDGIICDCYSTDLPNASSKDETLYAFVMSGVVVGYRDYITNGYTSGDLEKLYPSVESFFGSVAPDVVNFKSEQDSMRTYVAHWKLKRGSALGLILCPVQTIAGKTELKTPLRKCYLKMNEISIIRKFVTDPKIKNPDIPY